MLPGPPSCSSTSQEGSGHNNQFVICQIHQSDSESFKVAHDRLAHVTHVVTTDSGDKTTSSPHIWSLHDPRSEARHESSEAVTSVSPHRGWRDQEAGATSGSHPSVIQQTSHAHEIPGQLSGERQHFIGLCIE